MGDFSCKVRASKVSRNGGRRRGEPQCGAHQEFKCSGKSCGSMAGGIIADCVAVCCCPFAVVNMLTLVFVKVPYMMGKKCLRKMKKRKEKMVEREREGKLGSTEVESLERRICEMEEEEEEEDRRCSPRFEAEKVWVELYELGHLGFGRVSITDII